MLPRTLSLLERAGWRPDRKVDISDMVRAVRDAGFTLFPRQQAFLENFGGLVVQNFHCAEIQPWGLTIIESMGGPSAEHILNSPEYNTGLSFDVLGLIGSWRLDAQEDGRSSDLITLLHPCNTRKRT